MFAQVDAAHRDGDQIAHLVTRVDAIEAAATAQSAELDSKLDAAHQAATEMQRRIVEQLAERSTKRDADLRVLQGLETRLRETETHVCDLTDRSKKLAEAIDACVARLSAALERVSTGAFGRELVGRQHDAGEPSLASQIAGLVEALRGKSDVAVVEHIKDTNTQVCMGTTAGVAALWLGSILWNALPGTHEKVSQSLVQLCPIRTQ